MNRYLALLGALALPALCLGRDAPPDVQVKDMGGGDHLVTLTSATITNVPAAQAVLLPMAQKFCAGKTPQFGHYKYNSSAPMDASDKDKGTKSSFMVEQEVFCADTVAEAVQPAPSDPNWKPSSADYQTLYGTIAKYLAARDSGDVIASYALLEPEMKRTVSFKEWVDLSDGFTTRAGAAVSHKVVKLTWMKDPKDAPEPGIYAIADFEDHYQNIYMNCGYLAWRQQSDGSFMLEHAQDGLIPNDPKQDITPARLADLKAKFQCTGN